MAQWTPVHLPYNSDKIDLTLPTPQEIRACQDVLHDRFDAKIVAVNEQIVVKYGRNLDSSEGQALLYLERYIPEIPAPRLHAMFYDGHDLFIVMQRLPGERLDKLWPLLTDGEKDSITEQLVIIFNHLRQTKCVQPPFLGGVDGGPVRHYLFYSRSKGDRAHLGPFRDGRAFVKGLTDNLRALRERNHHPLVKVRFYEAHLLDSLKGLRPVLTHGDVQRRNILVAVKDRNVTTGERTFDVAIVDWEMTGWLPEFWEYFCASVAYQFDDWDDDWCLRVGQFLPAMLAETAVMHMFDKEVGP